MDALSLIERAAGLLSGSGGTHPVTLPAVQISYEQKDITADITPYLLSLSYTDYLGGQSDELQVDFEDVDGRWLRGWYPEQGDSLSLAIGDQFSGMVKLGNFELAEIEYSHPPSEISLKALSTGITRAQRTRNPRAYEKTTLAVIVRQVAARLKLSVTGTVRDIPIERVTQYQERDIEFLTRLAHEYGHTFKVVDQTLVFMDNAELAKTEAVAVLDARDIKRIRMRDLIKGVPDKVVATGYDAKTKKTVSVTRKAQPRRKSAKRGIGTRRHLSGAFAPVCHDFKRVAGGAALADAADEQCTGNITLVGNPKLVAGQVVQLKGYGKLSGRYLIKQARHEINRSSGYTTELEVKMVEYIDNEGKQDAGRA